jgi:hypothetical protein
MSNPVQFDYELPGGDMLEVNATVAPGRPERRPDLNHPGDPAEGPDIEITDCFLQDRNKNNPDLPFDPEGLYFRIDREKFKSIVDDMEEYAWDAYRGR